MHTQQQIAKDVWLLNNSTTTGVTRVEWHFFVSQHTGLGGPSKQLLQELLNSGFHVFFH